MHHRTSSSVSIVVCALTVLFLIFGETGFWLYAGIYLHTIRGEISEMIRENTFQGPLSIVTVANDSTSKSRLAWTEKDKEFLYEGAMYDVVRSIISDDSTTYCCIKDVKEQELRCQIHECAGNESRITFVFTGFDLPIVKDIQKSPIHHPVYPCAYQYPEWIIRHDKDPDLESVTPPPKSC